MNSHNSTPLVIKIKDFEKLPSHFRRVNDGHVEVMSKNTFVRAQIVK